MYIVAEKPIVCTQIFVAHCIVYFTQNLIPKNKTHFKKA